jgi:hypothetical protein
MQTLSGMDRSPMSPRTPRIADADEQDLNYIEMKIAEFKKQLEMPFFERRSTKHKRDPLGKIRINLDELQEVYSEIR